MLGQSFIIKKVIFEIAKALGASSDEAKRVAKTLALSTAIAAAVLSLDFVGLKASIIEELLDNGVDVTDADIDETTFTTETKIAFNNTQGTQVMFSGYLEDMQDHYSSSLTSNDLVSGQLADSISNRLTGIVSLDNNEILDAFRNGGFGGGGSGGSFPF
ncbi:MAG: hypothetical protein R2824_12735 [Saprospiraceae bacterium]|nr:hypothetical protein [Lewinella sp.]